MMIRRQQHAIQRRGRPTKLNKLPKPPLLLPPVLPPPLNLLCTMSFTTVMAALLTASCLFPLLAPPDLSNSLVASAMAMLMSWDWDPPPLDLVSEPEPEPDVNFFRICG